MTAVDDRVPLLEARGLVWHAPVTGGSPGPPLEVVRGIDLTIARGECLAIVGESGAGKTTLARLLLRLLEPSSGDVLVEGESLLALGAAELRRRRQALQMVFQDPIASLNPRLRVATVLGEAAGAHQPLSRPARAARVGELLEQVGLSRRIAGRRPSQLSGGEAQRVAVARALATNPRLLIADEPVASLDASLRAQLLNLLADLQQRLGLSLLLIAHDLSLVETMADRVAVLHAGRIVEQGPTAELFVRPRHPYTALLLASCPLTDPRRRRPAPAPRGDAPTLVAEGGCAFRQRCPVASERCRAEDPPLRPAGAAAPGRLVACHHPLAEASATAVPPPA